MFDWLYTGISWVLLRWHDFWALVLGNAHSWGGTDWDWLASIVSLVFTARLFVLPLYIKQLRAQRAMKALKPRLQSLQRQYGHDRNSLREQMMRLYQVEKVNPLMGCLPMFLQIPVFFGLYHVIDRLNPLQTVDTTIYGWTQADWDGAANARIFGAPIGARFATSTDEIRAMHASGSTVAWVAALMVVAMVTMSFVSSYLMLRETGWSYDPQQRVIQRLMLLGIPLSSLIAAWFLPIGVAVYWISQSLFTVGQILLAYRRLMRGFHLFRTESSDGVGDVDAVVAAIRQGQQPGAVPGGDATLIVLREIYSSGIEHVAPAGQVDRLVAVWVVAWLQTVVGTYGRGSGRVRDDDLDPARPCQLNWRAEPHGQLVAIFDKLARSENTSAATRTLAAQIVLSAPRALRNTEDDNRLTELVRPEHTREPLGTVGLAQLNGDSVDWLIRAARTTTANPVELADQLERDRLKGTIPQELLSWFGLRALWSDPRSPLLRWILRHSELRAVGSLAAVASFRGRRLGRRFHTERHEAYLSDVTTAITRRYVAQFGRDATVDGRWRSRHIILYLFARQVSRLARTADLRASAAVLVHATTPMVRAMQLEQMRERDRTAPARRQARNRFLVLASGLIPLAAVLGEIDRLVPNDYLHIVAPLLLGGLIHWARRRAGYADFLPWPLAVIGSFGYELLYITGILQAGQRLQLIVHYLTHYVDWIWWIVNGELLFGLLLLAIALRVPWTRAEVSISEAFETALPAPIVDEIEDVASALSSFPASHPARPRPANRAEPRDGPNLRAAERQ